MHIHPLILPALAAVAHAASYSGDLRPQIHFSPPSNFMNDPNGLVYDSKKGIYHLYYQYNPSQTVAGNQHWGHATSSDLYHWTNQPIALSGDKPEEYIFSGSAVIDSNNTSGFFPHQDDGVVAIFTVDTPTLETQNIAYSRDGGYTFTKYANNPVIDIGSKQFRDPQVVWHPETQQWVMTLAYAQDLVIGFYTSPNLRDWTHASNYTQKGLPGAQFECPNLVKFSVDRAVSKETSKYVLFISVNPGAPLGGSGTFYVVGNFNGTHFTSEVAHETLLDFSGDNYAAQWYSGIPENEPPVSIGWASNWDYTAEVPTGPLEGWRSAMTLPKTHTLTKVNGAWVVTHSPFHELSTIKGRQLVSKNLKSGNVQTNFSGVPSKAVYFNVTLKDIHDAHPTGQVNFNFTSSSGEYLDGGLSLDKGSFWINRAGTHLFTIKDNGNYTSSFNTTIPSFGKGTFSFSGVIDRSVLEVFLGEERTQIGTLTFFPTSPLDTLTVSAEGLTNQTSVSVKAWGLQSGWNSTTGSKRFRA
ncbi:glycosyl hydrolase [Aspergillus coremiiformis]|uniref:Glycosyl hydrolase n=1 Tax=Aspergillus coremiiformis TaxID=138285 RepID=A0A5N6Z711_9EURO|nr:glycosyl hydrolase [Aspergillus coremiiformis]